MEEITKGETRTTNIITTADNCEDEYALQYTMQGEEDVAVKDTHGRAIQKQKYNDTGALSCVKEIREDDERSRCPDGRTEDQWTKGMWGIYAETGPVDRRDDIEPIERAFNHPLNATTLSTQQNAKHVNATATFKNIIWSAWPLRIAAIVTSSVLSWNMSPPHARKKLASASVGGRPGRTLLGGPIQTKKYVSQRRTANAARRPPQSTWICIWKTYACACADMAAPVTPMTRAGKGLKEAR